MLYELERIASIENLNAQLTFEFENAEDLKILNNYLDTGKTVDFEDLFDIELVLDVKGQMKRVDLKEQVESAARICGQSLTAFTETALAEKAQRVLQEQERMNRFRLPPVTSRQVPSPWLTYLG